MKRVVTAATLAAALAVASGPAWAFQCPKLIGANRQAIEAAEKAGKDSKQIAEARRLNDEAQTLHEAGKHQEAVETANKAKAAIPS